MKKNPQSNDLLTTHYSLQTSRGFSLIETLVALAIFSIIIGGVVLFSVRTIQAHTKSQAMQAAIDNVRFAIEALNKKIRTSHEINDGDLSDGGAGDYSREKEVFVIDNVDLTKYCYKFDSTDNKLKMGKVLTTDAGYAATADCGDFATLSELVGNGGKIKVTGNFYVKATDESNSQRGFVTTVISIEYLDGANLVFGSDKFSIQSSVSVRDY